MSAVDTRTHRPSSPPLGLHAATEEEQEVHALRIAALDRFKARYRHNRESCRTMVASLNRVVHQFTEGQLNVATFPWELLVDEDLTQQVWDSVAATYARRTATRDASALRQMLDCCRKVGLLTHTEYQVARAFEVRGGRELPPAGRYLTESDVAALVNACATGRGGPSTRVRDVALVLTLASSGVRSEEMSAADLANTHLPEQRIWLVRTKSGKPRDAWLHPSAVDALSQWIALRGDTRGPLFVPLSRTGRPLHDHGRLSTHQIRKIVRTRGEQAGLGAVTSHDLRRFVISTLLARGVDITLIARTVGHVNPTTTAGYDRRPADLQRAAIARIELPRIPA